MKSKKKIYPSSVTFAMGDACTADNPNGCWRYQQLAYGVRTELDQIYTILGGYNEAIHAFSLDEDFQAEVPFKIEADDFIVSGRCDFLLENRIDECKASLSSSVKLGVIRDGKYKLAHLAQLCLYMLQFNKTSGRLEYAYYQRDPTTSQVVRRAQRRFEVTLTNNIIYVDGEECWATTDDLLRGINLLGQHINSDKPADPPIILGDRSPCLWCPLNDVCIMINETPTSKVSEYRPIVKDILESLPVRKAKITKFRKSKKEI